MPYFLNAPASMATNRGACRSETAGTATLIIFSGVSAENVRASGDSKKAVREIRMSHCFIGCSCPLETSITPRGKKCPARLCDRAKMAWLLVFAYKLLPLITIRGLTDTEPTCVIKTCSQGRYFAMVIRIAAAVLSLAGLLALILGLLFWTGAALNLLQMHMLLGLLAVGALLVIGIGQAFSRGGSWIIAVGTLVVGAATIVIGMVQASLMVGEFHWVIQVVHLLLGLLTIGMGHMGAARYRKSSQG